MNRAKSHFCNNNMLTKHVEANSQRLPWAKLFKN